MLKAINDKLIVKRISDVESTASGIILPTKKKTYYYEIVSIGELCERYHPGLKIGDRVVVSTEFALSQVDMVTEENKTVFYYSMRVGDVVCVIS